ncbi:MAG: DUF3486 family protein [Rhodospirillales bacterium]|nr:DUF3486 family protein [Rhodospirillales bacterium]
MQDESRRSPSGAAIGRSSVERLPPPVREAVDAAIADGASIDELAALIRENGGDCSRSAVGRYAKRTRDLIRRRHEAGRIAETWRRTSENPTEERTGLVAIEGLWALALLSVADLSGREEPVGTEELARLALVLRRLESSEKFRNERERAAAKAVPRRGLSPEAAAAIREAIQGKPDDECDER